jgi:N-acetylneuraminic acid mutarotase
MKKKSTSPSGPARRSLGEGGFLSLRTITILFCATAACSILAVPLLAFLRPQGQVNASQRTLTFEERVSYQRAIEEVYWRHRIWPKERPDAKPSIDAAMSEAQIERKVADYLRNSQVLNDYWQRPITADQLQAEMERMAQHTKQPEVLRELFEALGSDPFIIAECLARPALAERLLTNWYAYDQRIHGELRQRAEAEREAHPSIDEMKQLSGKYSEIEFVKTDRSEGEPNRSHEHGVKLNGREWDETIEKLAATFSSAASQLKDRRDGPPGRPSQSAHPAVAPYQTLPIGKITPLQEDKERFYATAVIEKTDDRLRLAQVSWSKEPSESWLARTETQIHAAMTGPFGDYTLPTVSDGGCTDDTWRDIAGPPDARSGQTAVWTGSEMIIWGGPGFVDVLNTGGRYSPATDSWTSTTLTNAPDGRFAHTAVWSGSEMIVWGGYIWDDVFGQIELNTGGRYNPISDSWTATSTTNAPSGRDSHTAVWTGSEMIVWGGYDGFTNISTGGKYDPGTNSWVATDTTNAPSARGSHTAVWTGSEMIIWGGYSFEVGDYLNTGARYHPDTDSWTPAATTNGPAKRAGHTAVWTGNEMLVWGGYDGSSDLNSGGKYDPSTNSWTASSTINAPAARAGHTAVWTGSVMIVWGGVDNVVGYSNTGGRYDPSTNVWTATEIINAPAGRTSHTAVWTSNEMIVWGGTDGSNDLNTGGRYNPTTDSWTATNTGNTPMGRYRHSAVWTGSEMIIWGGRSRDLSGFFSLDSGGQYTPSTDSWTATSMVNTPSARNHHTAVWAGSEMIVWGGFDAGTFFNTGGRYNPITNSWTATSTTNAPADRWFHTAVWTGNRMVVWGGSYDDGSGVVYLNSGGRYDPNTDGWTTTSTTNAPTARDEHVAVWTGDEMIIWGGYFYDGNDHYLNTGGRYNPETDTWAATSTAKAPSARSVPKTVWTGEEMIVWGGYGDAGYLNTGGRFNPSANSWAATSTSNAPTARAGHGVVWTGSEMIVWGGLFFDGDYHFLDTGGRYDPSSNSWAATSMLNVPPARTVHTAVWADSEMIVWGGQLPTSFGTSTGGRYCAQSGPTPTPSPTPTPTATPRVTPRPRPSPHVRPSPG